MPRVPVRLFSLVVAASTPAGLAGSAAASDLVFVDVLNSDPEANSIRLVHDDGSGLRTLITTGAGVRSVDVDSTSGLIYWTDVDNFVIRRARFDGSMQQDLITENVQFPATIRLFAAESRMFWGDGLADELYLADLSGSGNTPITATPFFRGIALDTTAQRIYWTTSDSPTTGRIFSANFIGLDPQLVVPVQGASFKPGSLAIDAAGGKLYWTDAASRTIRRANLDGTGMQTLFSAGFIGPPKGIAVDSAAGKVYWGQDIVDEDSGGLIGGEIRRMNLDGSTQEILVTGLGSVNDLAVVNLRVCFADFNGSGSVTVQDIFDFLAAYFTNSPFADFNHSGSVTVQDIFDFLQAYFAGC